MKQDKAISSAVIRRLPKYYRYLGMIQDRGIVRISSQNLSEITGFTASQIRQDLNHFGGFGQQGYGYNVTKLREQLGKIIGLDQEHTMVIVGTGHMGQAICKYRGFRDSGFRITALFDRDPSKIGTRIDDIEVLDVEGLGEYIERNHTDIVAITTPKAAAQSIADVAAEHGIKGIWNFAPVDLRLPEGVVLENVHLDESLHALIYYIRNIKDYVGV